MKKALFLGLAGSFFFAFTFVLNRSMNLSGGYWLWSAVLRYFFMLPLLLVLLLRKGQVAPVLGEIHRAPWQWLLWSTVGFGLFYAPLSAASVFAEGWFTASVWQFTIVAGVLLAPLFGQKIPVRNLLWSCLILLGIVVMMLPRVEELGGQDLLAAAGLIALAAFSYPLGNRKMMALCGQRLNTIQRIFGMTLCSIPFWSVCCVGAYLRAGVPAWGQVFQSFCVAVFSGVIATILFFHATDLVRSDQKKLAVVEATQSGEVVFTSLLSVLFLHDTVPSPLSFAGIALIVLGMICNSLATARGENEVR